MEMMETQQSPLLNTSISPAQIPMPLGTIPAVIAKNKVTGPRRPRSVVWYYFDKIVGESQRAKCKLCGSICHHANNTSNLFKHLRVKHPATFKDAENQRDSEMDKYVELKAMYGKPITRPIRARRQKAVSTDTASPMAGNSPIIKTEIKSTPTFAPSGGGVRKVTPAYISERQKMVVNKALLKMLTVDLIPMSVVEGKGFRDFVRCLDQKYEPPIKKDYLKSLLNDYTEETKNKIKLDVVMASFFALTVDPWICRGTESYLTLSAHFIKDSWEMASFVLETFDRTEDLSAEALTLNLKRVAEEWNISERVITIVSKDEQEIVTDWEPLNCFGHTLNTVILNALKCVTEIVRIQKKTSDAVSYFETCVKASDTLSAVQQQHSLPMHKLKQENPKFWNSTYIMFVRTVEQYEAVNTVLCFLGKDHMCLCDDEVENLRNIIEVLKPFHAATEEICTSHYTFMSKVIPIATLLQQVTAASPEPALPGPQSALKAALLLQMQQHFSSYENTYQLAVSTLLDPRFKKHAFTDMAALNSAEQRLLGEITTVVENSDPMPSSVPEPLPAYSDGDSGSSFWNMFDRKVSEAGAMKNTASEAENESRRYFKEANIPRKADPLQWWKLNEVQFPHLKMLAQKYLCIPATSVSSERLFSKQGDVVDARRELIKPSQVNQVLFLNKNLAS